MLLRPSVRAVVTGAAFAALLVTGVLLLSPPGHAANENNAALDEQQMSQTGLAIAGSLGIPLNIGNNDPEMVGLGSYLVNVVADCNGCHSDPVTSSGPGGNPYLLPGANPPFFSGNRRVNGAKYLGGNQDFGSFGPGMKAEIISRNITPDKTGLAAGGLSLTDFIQLMRTGVDRDHAHPSCSGSIKTDCLAFPFNGDLLQVMPWPAFQNMTDRQLTAIYKYISSVPCLEGGPGEMAHRCS